MRGRRLDLAALASSLLIGGALLAFASRHTPWPRGGEPSLEDPAWLALLALWPLLWLVHRRSLTDLARGQRRLLLGARSLLVLLIAVALARPSALVERRGLCTVALVDASDSVGDGQLAEAARIVEGLRQARRGDDLLQVVSFAVRPRRVELPGEGRLPLGPEFAASLRPRATGEPGDGSDLQAAVQLATALLPPDRIPRLILLSDGNQTQGEVVAEVAAARRRGARTWVFPLAAGRDDEVLVRELTLPSGEVRPGAPFAVRVEIFASRPVAATVRLWRGETPAPIDHERQVALVAGRNELTFRTQVDEPGFARFRVAVELPREFRDRFPANNGATAALAVRGRPRILLVDGDPATAAPLQQALRGERIDVELRGPSALPPRPEGLAPFDLVVLSDVAAPLVGPSQMAALESYVQGGGGFLMSGGEGSFGSGGWSNTTVERLLPVRFEGRRRREQPALALVLAIDRSGSMHEERRLELAKEAARATAELLGPEDLLGVVAFDAQATVLAPLQRAATRLRLLGDISRLTPGGGTELLPPLVEAYDLLATAPAKVKHVILLTDGQASYEGIAAQVDRLARAKITVSAVGVGGEADRSLLSMIAERGGGRFHYTRDAQSIPRIFTKETAEVARTALVEEPIRARVAKSVQLLDGVPIAQAPPLGGYGTTRAKPTAEVILTTDDGAPLLARWRVGLGQVAAWTSDLKARWAAAWIPWPGYAQLVAQLARSLMRHRPLGGEAGYPITCEVDPPRVRVAIDAVGADDRFVTDLETSLEISDPQRPGEARTVPLPETAPGRYEGELPFDRPGTFQLRATHRRRGQPVAESTGTVTVPYSREYLALPPDEPLLRRLAAVGGGTVAPRPEALFAAADEAVRSRRPLWPWPVAAAVVLLVIDVALRRLRLLGYRPLGE